jgi:hypothetical protein
MSNTITLQRRKVIKIREGYVVIAFDSGSPMIEVVSKAYAHSTSAFAALGRLVQKDTLAS